MTDQRSLTTELRQIGVEPVTYRALQDQHPGANANSLMMVLRYCQASKLDPLRSPVVILPIDGKQVPVLSINGLRAHAVRTGQYAGSELEYAGETVDVEGLALPAWCICRITRLLADGTRAEFSGQVWAEECVSKTKAGKSTKIWRERGRHMLGIAAERLALRRAFPESVPPDDAPAREQIDPNTGEIRGAAPLHLSDADIAAGIESIEQRETTGGDDEWLEDYDA